MSYVENILNRERHYFLAIEFFLNKDKNANKMEVNNGKYACYCNW